jgi:hypothetical protein
MFIQRVTTNNDLQSNTVNAVIEDANTYYIITIAGLDVLSKTNKSRVAYITRTGGYSCITQSATTIFLGTSNAGIFSISKVNLSGNSGANVSVYLSTTTTPATDSNDIKCISYDNSIMIFGTELSVNYFNGTNLYKKANPTDKITNAVNISYPKFYYAVQDNGIGYKSSAPTGNDWSNSTTYLSSQTINAIEIIKNESTVDINSNRLCIADASMGAYIIDTDETTDYDNKVVTNFDNSDLAGGIDECTLCKVSGSSLYIKTDNTTVVGYTKINLSTKTVSETFEEI